MREISFVSLSGILGYGYPAASLERALQARPDFIGVDAGSTDPGPYYLGSGTGFVRPTQVRRDLELGLLAALRNGIPLIVGTAGGSGARPHVEQFLRTLSELADAHNLHFRLAVIWADFEPDSLIHGLRQGKVRPCGPAPELTEERVRACAHIVGQMGTGPIIRALEQGAQVVVAGRACDAAVFAAPAIRAGFDPGLALHLGKIAECGALCADPASAADCVVGRLREDHFLVSPANPDRRCTPDSVAAHSLYEQPDP
ncbi:MAG: acyclic terpene utilization AtuA family protein, partial [Bacillota bacterium]|nr:acyclic terpene utilization AtuA family protein [Bacillota bacterium]